MTAKPVAIPSRTSPLLTPADVERELELPRAMVRQWIRSGVLPSIELSPRLVRVRRADLEAFTRASSLDAIVE